MTWDRSDRPGRRTRGAAARPLYLDHLGPPVGQDAGRARPGDIGGKINDLQTLRQPARLRVCVGDHATGGRQVTGR
jgi:hypothetical protein